MLSTIRDSVVQVQCPHLNASSEKQLHGRCAGQDSLQDDEAFKFGQCTCIKICRDRDATLKVFPVLYWMLCLTLANLEELWMQSLTPFTCAGLSVGHKGGSTL